MVFIYTIIIIFSCLGCATTTSPQMGTVLKGNNSTVITLKTENQGEVTKIFDENNNLLIILYPRPFKGELVGTDRQTGENVYIRTDSW